MRTQRLKQCVGCGDSYGNLNESDRANRKNGDSGQKGGGFFAGHQGGFYVTGIADFKNEV